MSKLHRAAIAAGFAMAACLPAAHAGATHAYLDQMSSGAGACAAALPVHDTQLRKRPMALQNEGTAVAFATCTPPQLLANAGDPDLRLQLKLLNLGDADATVTCTGVGDLGEVAGLSYTTRTVTVPAGGDATVTFGSTVEIDPIIVGASCGLPPGTGIGRVVTFGSKFQLAP